MMKKKDDLFGEYRRRYLQIENAQVENAIKIRKLENKMMDLEELYFQIKEFINELIDNSGKKYEEIINECSQEAEFCLISEREKYETEMEELKKKRQYLCDLEDEYRFEWKQQCIDSE